MAQNDYQFQDVNLQVTQWSHFSIFKFGSGHFFLKFFPCQGHIWCLAPETNNLNLKVQMR